MFFKRAAALPALGFFVLLSSSTVSWAQDEVDKEPVSEAAVRADLQFLYQALSAAHFDLFANKTKQAYDALFQEIESSIIGAMSRLEVVRLLMPFVAFADIGHARIDFPIPAYVEYLQQGGTLIPIDIEIVQGQIQIAHAYTDDETLAPGMVLVAINGESAAEWVARVSRYVSAERPYMTHAQLETMFPRLVWLVAGQIDRFELTVRNSSGELQTVTVDAIPVMKLEEHKGRVEAVFHRREAKMLDASIAYLRPGPFYAVTEDESAETFVQFLDHAFAEFLKADAKDLIVDLRNNPGGDNSYSDPMIAWFADQPFHFASRFTVKASDQTRVVLKNLAKQDPDGISAQMLQAMRSVENGERFDFSIPLTKPRKEHFAGNVWVLVNRHSYSNATSVAAIIQDYGFGRVVGEETADVPTSYASSAQFTLPNTGIVVTYPKAYFVRPSGDEVVQGVVPDHVLTPDPEAVQQLILELR